MTVKGLQPAELARCELPVADRTCGVKKASIKVCGTCDYYDPQFEVRYMKVCTECGGEVTPKGRLTENQRKAISDWNDIVGIPFMHGGEIRDGSMTFKEAWNDNIRWLEGVLGTAMNLYKGESNSCICVRD